MNTAQLAKDLVRDEGSVTHAYQDSEGFWSIGVGRLIDKRKGGRISEEEILFLLANDIQEVVGDLDRRLPWWRRMSETRQRVIANMRFNLGMDGLLGFRNTLKAMEEGRYEDAALGMLASKWAKQVGKRAERLAEMMKKGVDDAISD